MLIQTKEWHVCWDINLCINDLQRGHALLCQMRSVGCHVEREILPQFPVWSFFSRLRIPTFPIWRCGTACRPYAISDHVCVSACQLFVCVCRRLWACPAVSSMSNVLLSPWRARTMRSIRAQLSNWGSKPVMHLMLDVVMETRGADFPLHWLPSVYSHFLNYFQGRQLKDGRGKISEVSTKILRRHSKTQKYRNEKFTVTPYFN